MPCVARGPEARRDPDLHADLLAYDRTGRPHWFEVNARPTRDPSGRVLGAVAAVHDITGQYRARQYERVVVRNNTRLRQIVEQLLDLAALESGYATLTAADVDLAATVTAAVATYAAAAQERRIHIDVTTPATLTIPGDGHRLRQVVDNLIDNAVKFSPDDATVTLTDDGNAAVLTITDTGIGIPVEDQPHLFRRLYRGRNARHTGIPGTGLGLALARVVVERHHGTITLAPQQPTGTIVTARLPRAT